MLKKRIIPVLLWDHLGLVKGTCFQSWRRVGIPLPAVQIYNQREVDELVFLDIRATREKATPDYTHIKDLSSSCFVPFTVGGGIKSLQEIRDILCAGADKISINSASYKRPSLVQEAAQHFGSQCIVVSIDVKKNSKGVYTCFSHSGTQDQNIHPIEWAQHMASLGAGEILLTSIERDGTMQGYDLDLIKSVTQAVEIPVIAAGGAGNPQHAYDALTKANAHAVAIASMFHFTEQTPKDVKTFLQQEGIPVRVQ